MMKQLLCLVAMVFTMYAAAQISQNLDTSVDPCEDFYQFSCGGWEAMNPLPPGESVISVRTKLKDESFDAVKKVLEEAKSCNEPSYIIKLKNFYKACVNQGKETQMLQDLRNIIDTGFGGWPITSSSWDESTISVEEAVLEASRHNVETLCSFAVIPLGTNKTRNMLRARQPIFPLDYVNKFKVDRMNPTLLALEDRIFEISKIIYGNNIDETSLRFEAAAILDFERELALMSSYYRSQTAVYLWALYKWQGRYSSQLFDWINFFNNATATPEVGVYDVTPDELIYRGPDMYFLELKSLLEDTPKRTVINYIVWRVIDTYWDMVNHTVQQDSEATERACLETVILENDLKFASSRVFLNEKFRQEDEDMVSDMIPYLKEGAEELMDQLTWIDEESLQLTKEKLDHTRVKLGFPESRYTDTYLNNYYSELSITNSTHLLNTVAVKRLAWIKMVQRLRVPNQEDDLWFFLPIHVNSYADVRTNSIEFPAIVFLPPYFSSDNLRSLNYGALGSVIGYQLAGGYDIIGVQFDKDGNSGFWNSTQRASLNQQSKCLVDQYNGYFDQQAQKSVNGQQTLIANIGDNAGVRTSFRAYRNWVADQGLEELPLPGLAYSQDQLFFIARAQIYCEIKSDERAVMDVTWDRYSPGRYRVNGPNQNSEDFAAAFNCPVNSTMNPANKCVVW